MSSTPMCITRWAKTTAAASPSSHNRLHQTKTAAVKVNRKIAKLRGLATADLAIYLEDRKRQRSTPAITTHMSATARNGTAGPRIAAARRTTTAPIKSSPSHSPSFFVRGVTRLPPSHSLPDRSCRYALPRQPRMIGGRVVESLGVVGARTGLNRGAIVIKADATHVYALDEALHPVAGRLTRVADDLCSCGRTMLLSAGGC